MFKVDHGQVVGSENRSPLDRDVLLPPDPRLVKDLQRGPDSGFDASVPHGTSCARQLAGLSTRSSRVRAGSTDAVGSAPW